jgi:hypothetical protein
VVPRGRSWAVASPAVVEALFDLLQGRASLTDEAGGACHYLNPTNTLSIWEFDDHCAAEIVAEWVDPTEAQLSLLALHVSADDWERLPRGFTQAIEQLAAHGLEVILPGGAHVPLEALLQRERRAATSVLVCSTIE